MIKKCKKHGLTEYVKRKDGRYRCKKCSVEAVQKRRDNIKIMAVKYKGGKCQNPKCGYDKYIGALEFHHLYDKEFGISSKGYTRSWGIVKEELKKSVLVCSNYHKEIHGGLLDVGNIVNENYEFEEKKINYYYYNKCGCEINKNNKLCNNCHITHQRKIERPPYEQLKKEIEETSCCAVGHKYGVSDNDG